jgi:hypothetical protein
VSGEIAVIPLVIVAAAALAWSVLREELERARDHTIRRRKGAACLL